MSRKALRVVVELEIQAVTCPGVWLCPNGDVQLLFSMLGQDLQTKRLPAIFPLLFHEKLVFQKTYKTAGCLAEVQNALSQEDVYAVLFQETDKNGYGAAVQLARFHSTALQILYPSPCSKGLLAGVDVDLLMEPSIDYPGILSPKIEVSTKTIIEEVTNLKPDGFIINPKTLSSQKVFDSRGRAIHKDVKLVQSNGRHKKKIVNQTSKIKCTHHLTQLGTAVQSERLKSCSYVRTLQDCGCTCPVCLHYHGDIQQCEMRHLSSSCPLCVRYKTIFGSMPDYPPEKVCENGGPQIDTLNLKHNQQQSCNLQNAKRLSTALHARVDRVLDPTMSTMLNLKQTSIAPTRTAEKRKTSSQESDTRASTPYNIHGKNGPNTGAQCSTQMMFNSLTQPSISCGDGADLNSSRQLFYTNLERFYRKLYSRAKLRAQEEMCPR